MSLMSDIERARAIRVTPAFKPANEIELAACLASWEWRIYSGGIYKIKAKADPTDPHSSDIVVPFVPNGPQRDFLNALHYRNIILKARQLGFSTLIEIMALDHALWNDNQTAVIIAQDLNAANDLFRNKIRFAYRNLPQAVKDMRGLVRENESQLEFDNGSVIAVTTSARSGTVNFLHVSEMGKISAASPKKAREVRTGSLQAVPSTGIAVIESTAEGMGGDFHEMSNKARADADAEKDLTPSDYRFHFFPWWQDPAYRSDPARVVISSRDHAYFDEVEGTTGACIDLDQRAWYVAKRDSAEFVAEPHDMLREYPSTPDEAWQASKAGKYLSAVMAQARREGRIGKVPLLRHVPVNTFWDVGASDDTCIWLHQRVGAMDHWVGYREAQGEGYLADVQWLERLDLIWGAHYLPHDADHAVKNISDTRSAVAQLRLIKPSWTWRVVPRVANIQFGIDKMRTSFASYWFDEKACKEGLAHLDAYSREWNDRLQVWHDYPRHDEHSHAADALRQHGQILSPITDKSSRRDTTRSRASSMTA